MRKDGSIDPYKVLVSEIMLQQTQVDRVIPFYTNFLKRFPNIAALAKAPLSEVLICWHGLGYNRRAKMLHECAKAIVARHGKAVPRNRTELLALPGVGPYIAGAVRAFAFNEPEVFIETNIRTVYTHHFLNDHPQVLDAEVVPLIEATLDTKNPRLWYSALMDYGSYLKKSGIKINAKNAAYKKQSKFEGSDRQVRGALLRALIPGAVSERMLLKTLADFKSERVKAQLSRLLKEGMVVLEKKKWRLP